MAHGAVAVNGKILTSRRAVSTQYILPESKNATATCLVGNTIEAVKLAKEPGVSVVQAARDPDVHETML